MIGILRHHDIGDHCLGRQAALDQARRCRRLHHTIRACAAGKLRPACHDHPINSGDLVETLGCVLADDVQRALALGTAGVLGFDDDIDARQMRGQCATIATARRRTRALDDRVRLFLLGLALGDGRLDILERELRLIVRQLFRAASKAGPLQLLDDLAQRIVLAAEFVVRGDGGCVGKSSRSGDRALGHDQRVQRVDVGW